MTHIVFINHRIQRTDSLSNGDDKPLRVEECLLGVWFFDKFR